MTVDWDVVGYVISSEHRTAVLGALLDGPSTPTQLADDLDLSVTHVSRALRSLRDRGLVELLVPEDRRKGRLYGLTSDGRDVWNVIERDGLVD